MQTCVNSALCLFDSPPVQTDIISSKLVDYHPVTNIAGNDIPIHFEISANPEEYIDCQGIDLELRLKITKSDGTNIDSTKDTVGLTNLAIASLFQDVTLTLNDKQIEGGDHTYPYGAYLSTLTQFQSQAKKTHLKPAGWCADEYGKFDHDSNKGFVEREKWSANSVEMQLKGPVYLDFFRQSRYLLSQVNMRLKFIRAKSDFSLMSFSGTNYKVNITSAILFVRKVLMNPKVINDHSNGLKSHNAIYPVNHTELTTFTIPVGSMSHTRDRLFPICIPKALYITLVDNEAYNGDFKKNPFNFQHFNINKLALYADGDYVVYKPFEPNFKKNECLREYCSTFMSLNMFNTDDSNGVTYEQYKKGYFYLLYDMTPDSNLGSGSVNISKPGNLRLELSFESPLKTTVNVLLYAIYDSKIEITQLRDVLASYQR